jgi:benzoyl-CoA 2,3-dioxygenase component A
MWDSPALALIRSNEAVTRAADGAEVRHIVLEFAAGEFPVLEGQSIGIVPPGCDELGRKHHVRLYSVASARDGEFPGTNTVALTVKRVLQDHNGKGVRGVCSNYLCDLPVGASAHVTGPVGDTFLMPDDPGVPLLMVCTGTGVAPMRGMIQRRLRLGCARREDLMLVYGGRRPDELPYLEELASRRAEQLDLNIGYSRVAGTPRTYVQDLLLARRVDVAYLMRDRGACLYLCGLRSMELGVKQALAEILGLTDESWEHYSRRLAASGRFHVEVY